MVDHKEPSAVKVQRMSKSAVKVFDVLDVLERNFVHGFSPTEIAKETGYSLSDINSYVNTLLEAGRAERIQETGRIRVSHKAAQKALQILHALDEAERQITQSRARITRI
jgi:DNA-binding IclR family transcriptional regulator